MILLLPDNRNIHLSCSFNEYKTSLKVFYTNADQFLNKRDDLLLHIAGNEPDVIMITEVLPKVQSTYVSDVQLQIPGYKLYTNFKLNCDLSGPKGRGIVIYLSHDLVGAHQVHFNTSNFEEQNWISIPLKGHDTLLIGCIYRSPSDMTLSSTTSLCNLFTSLCNYTHLLICGDFNYPNIDWVSMSSSSPNSQQFLRLACHLAHQILNSFCKQYKTSICISMFIILLDTGKILHPTL